MRDTVIKLRILAVEIRCTFDGWLANVWRRDLDARYCCDGRECGCEGITILEAHMGAYYDNRR